MLRLHRCGIATDGYGLFASMLRQPPDRPLSSSWQARKAGSLTEKAELCAAEQSGGVSGEDREAALS